MDEEDPDMGPRVARRGRRARPEASQEDGGDAGGGGASIDPNDPVNLFGSSARPDASFDAQGSQNQRQSEEASAPPPPRRGGFNMSFDNDSGESSSPQQQQQQPRPPPSGPALDPLADDGSNKKFVGVSRRKQDQRVREDEEKEKAMSKYDDLAVGTGIMDIPELEEEGREDLSRVVAEAPKVRSNKVQGIDELDEDMQFRLPFTDDRDIDLSLLTTVLCSSEQVNEEDDVWDPDMLFSAVASELYQEQEKAEGIEADASGESAKDDLAQQMANANPAIM